jgi:hypothetical protein
MLLFHSVQKRNMSVNSEHIWSQSLSFARASETKEKQDGGMVRKGGCRCKKKKETKMQKSVLQLTCPSMFVTLTLYKVPLLNATVAVP